MKQVYIVEQRPRKGLNADAIKLTFFLSGEEALNYYSLHKTNVEYCTLLIKRISGGSLIYEGANG